MGVVRRRAPGTGHRRDGGRVERDPISRLQLARQEIDRVSGPGYTSPRRCGEEEIGSDAARQLIAASDSRVRET
jgi:hypothetical protein